MLADLKAPVATQTGEPLAQLIEPTAQKPVDGVHGTPGVQLALHIPMPVQEPPLHAVPIDANTSAGHVAVPAHVSATSQPPATAGRQTLAAVANASTGQLTLAPLQVSATSQTPAPARQTVAADA